MEYQRAKLLYPERSVEGVDLLKSGLACEETIVARPGLGAACAWIGARGGRVDQR
jgi:hypothetical protein